MTASVRGAWRVFVVAFALTFGAMALWSFATPLFGAPDEPVHIVKAAAVVRGELLGNLARGRQSPFALVRVPEYFALLRWPGSSAQHSRICFHAHPDVPASCVVAADNGVSPQAIVAGATRQAWIYNARYPPLYYAIVGLPSLFSSGLGALYAMRLFSALISSLFIAVAAAMIKRYSSNAWLYLALAVATTPMVLFLGGVVNPSGFEVAAGICTWVLATVLVTERLAAPPRGLLVALGASASVFVLIRSLSPLWLALIGLFVLCCADGRELLGALRRRDVQVMLAAVAVVSALAFTWIVKENATAVYSSTGQIAAQVPPSAAYSTILKSAFQRQAFYLPDMVGVFGWFDTWAPSFTYVVWYCLVCIGLVLALVVARLRQKFVMLALGVAVIALPTFIIASQARHAGYIWSGRDALPLAVGLPLLGAGLIGRHSFLRLETRIVLGAGIFVLTAQFLAFYQALRRYAVGARGPVFSFITHPSWHPPLAVLALLILELVVLAAGLIGLAMACGHLVPVKRREPSELPSEPALQALAAR